MDAKRIYYSCFSSRKDGEYYAISESKLEQIEKILDKKGYFIEHVPKGHTGGYWRYLFMNGEAVLSDVGACFIWGLELAAKNDKSLEKMANALGTFFPKNKKG